MNKYIFVGLVCLMGCRPPQVDTSLNIESPVVAEAQRFKITRVGVIGDDLAYGNRRGIYVIRDTHTGKEFVGISGVGISELGSHQNDDDNVPDER